MSEANPILILAALIGIAAAVILSNNGKSREIAERFVGGMTLPGAASLKPKLWFVVDDYGSNSRRWVDFGARNSRDLNIGFLNITRGRCSVTQGGDFEIVELLGRDAVAKAIREHGGVVPSEHLTVYPYIWRAWARAALLNYAGGLYLDGLSLCLGPSFAKSIRGLDDATFGFEHDERIVDPVNSDLATCSPFAGWASGPGHIGWRGLCNALGDFINSGNQSWSAAQGRNQIPAWNRKYLDPMMRTVRTAEWSRRPDGRAIEIEDLFGRTGGSDRWEPSSSAVYIPLDKELLERSVTYKWFLSMSTEQILDPDSLFLWATLAKRTGSRDNLFTL